MSDSICFNIRSPPQPVTPIVYFLCYFIIGLQDRYGIGDSIGGAQLTMEEVWIVQTGNFTLNGLVLLLFCNFFGKVKVVLEPQDMLADLIRVLAFA